MLVDQGWANPTDAAMITRGAKILKKHATESDLGGIDMNAAHLNLHIKRDGHGVALPFSQQDLAQLSNLEGLDPVVVSITPASQTILSI